MSDDSINLAREKAKIVLVHKKIFRQFDKNKMDKNVAGRYYEANAGNTDRVEIKLKGINANYLILESDISNKNNIKKIYFDVIKMITGPTIKIFGGHAV